MLAATERNRKQRAQLLDADKLVSSNHLCLCRRSGWRILRQRPAKAMSFTPLCVGMDPGLPVFFGDCLQECSTRGHKGTVAAKTWHGRQAFDGECESAIHATAPATKYLSKRITLSLQSSASSSDDFWTGFLPESALPVHCESTGEFSHDRSVLSTVNRNSGVISISSCIENKDGPTYAGGCSVGGDSPTPASTGFDDLLCGPPSYAIVPWADIFSMMEACAGYIWSTAPDCATALTDWQTPRTAAEIEAYYNGAGGNYTTNTSEERICQTDGAHVFVTSQTTVSTTAAVLLTGTQLEIHIEQTIESISNSYMRTNTAVPAEFGGFSVACELPTSSHYSKSSTVDLSIELAAPYTYSELNSEVNALLALRPLTDHAYYTWHYGCSFPLIFRDEVADPVGPDGFQHGNCAWTDPNATAGGLSGTGYTGAVTNGSGAISYTWNSGATPDGAFKSFGLMATGRLMAGKYAQILQTRPRHQWYRPCGPDRALLDFLSNQRYPDAWPICVSLTITNATNTTPIEITVSDTHNLATGDLVDVSGVLVNTSANGSDWAITVTGATTFTLDTSVGNGAYGGGGDVFNAASTSPPSSTWNDDTPDGDFLLLEYNYNNRAIAIDPTIRENNALYGFDPGIESLSVTLGNIPVAGTRIVCITPNAENFGANSLTYAFPASFTSDWRYGSQWIHAIQQRMRNPIDMVVNTDHVEARNSKPTGAPDLPSFDNGGIQTDGCDFQNNNPHICPYINILTIAEITSYADAVIGGVYPVTEGVVAAPLFVCSSFDNDIP